MCFPRKDAIDFKVKKSFIIPKEKISKFWESVKQASKEVKSWPEWKQKGSMIQRYIEKKKDVK